MMALLAVLIVSGCGDARSIDNRAMIFALSADAGNDGRLQLMGEEINPLASASTTVQAPSGAAGPQVIHYRGEASSASEALSQMQASSPKDLDFSDLGILVFSRALAQHGLAGNLDFLVRGARVRPLAWVIVADGSAADILRLRPQAPTGSAFRDLFLAQGQLGASDPRIFSEPLWRLYRGAVNREEDPVAPLVRIEQKKLVFVGSALFRDGQMRATLGPNDTALLEALMDSRPRQVVRVAITAQYTATLRLEEVQSSVKVAPGPRALIRLRTTATLVEVEGQVGTPSIALQRRIQQLAADRLKTEIIALYQHLQACRCDALGLGKLLRASQPHVWDAWHTTWPDGLSQVPASVEVRVTISSPET